MGQNDNQENSNTDLIFDSNNNQKNEDILTNFKRKKLYFKIAISIVGILLLLVIIAVLIFMMLSGIMYVSDGVASVKEQMINFFSGCGWSTEQECAIKEENNFYEYVDEKYNNYKDNFGVEIDKGTLISTLTYVDPFITGSSDSNVSNMVDYKKSKKQVDELIDEMVKCYVINKKTGVTTYKDCDYNEDEETEEKVYYIDEEGFRKYLEETFVINYFLEGKITEENKMKALDIVEEIYARVEFVNYLYGSSNTSDNFTTNNVMVTVTDCTGNITLEQVTLYEYLQGVIYMYGGDYSSLEYLRFIAVAAKNYLYSINGATEDYMPTYLRIRNCEQNQLYCNIKTGCHYMNGNNKDDDTLTSGPDDENNYFKSPINDIATINKIKSVIDETINVFVVEDGDILKTDLSTVDSKDILSKLSDKTYIDVLIEVYGGNTTEIDVTLSNYPLDIKYMEVTSLYGWRIHPVDKVYCSHHNGMDIAADADANIYAYDSGVIITNSYHSAYGYHTVIGHGDYDEQTDSYEYYTLYAHQIRLSGLVSVGSTVSIGQKIGNVGTTGVSTGNHLHFEIFDTYVDETPSDRKDPATYFKNINFTGLDVNVPLYESEAQCSANL